MAVNLRTSRSFNMFLKVMYAVFITPRYRVRVENREFIAKLKPPYALLPNHVGFWDPFFVSYYTPHPVQYVVTDRQFRVPVVRFLLGLVGAIPKSKAISDFETVRNIFRVKQKNGIVGIFAEGMRNWNGCALEPLYSASKLLKVLKIPVVVPLLKGAYMVLPRWSRIPNRGPITIEYIQAFTTDEIKSMSVDEIHGRLSDIYSYSEWEYQREHMHVYKGRRRAEHIELALFICPECTSIGGLRSKRHVLTCSSCGYSVEYNMHGFFERSDGHVRFDNVKDWDTWQLDHLKRLLDDAKGNGKTDPVMSDDRCVVWRGYRREPEQKHTCGRLSLFVDRFEIDTAGGGKIVHTLDKVQGINVQLREVMEYYFEDFLYTFQFEDPWVSGYKWMVAVNLLHGKKPLSADLLS